MSDELLQEATRALKAETDELDAEGRFTRARVMATLHQSNVKRRTRLAFVLPLAACFAAGTAWGAATGRLPAVFDSLVRAVTYTSKQAPVNKSPVVTAPRVSRSGGIPAQAPDAPDAPDDRAETPFTAPRGPELGATAPTPRDDLRQEAAATLSRPVDALAQHSSSAPARRVTPDRDSELYRVAHEAHFARQDPASALLAWQEYLRLAPDGRFATEARYNRALCLLRLGRTAEAREALAPFAAGKLGYRQQEARELLAELERTEGAR